MPVRQSAIRTLRVQNRRRIFNLRVMKTVKSAIREMRQNPTVENLKKVFSELDTAAKKGIIHDNKASRIKSRLSALLTSDKASV
ncbi:30S ribosomal protein S20 [candidate division WWE3 bacterium]|nr:30S ribosomal protein S20 [candidate division WWE3 bacterium]